MRLLLDTHILLWALVDDAKLPKSARDLIEDPANEIYVSAASVWEIAIKHALARGSKTDMPISGADAIRYCRAAGYRFLDVSPLHAAGVETLPTIHADPFDRILVSQALAEPLRLLTADPRVAGYSNSINQV